MKLLFIRSVIVRGALLCALLSLFAPGVLAQTAAKPVGTVESITGDSIVLKSDSGPDLTISFSSETKVLRAAPGQTLKDATPIKASDIQTGDRMLARGTPGSGPNSLAATTIVVMSKGDVTQRQQQEMQAWTRNGVGGIVSNVDPSAGTITIKTSPGNSAAVHTSAKTQFMRYAGNSTKFADATPSNLAQIRPGDQLRARGTKSADGKEIAADAVIAGSFRNIAGTISALDPAAHSLTIKDLLSKQTITVVIAPDSQLKKLPPPMAMRIGMMLKGGGAEGESSGRGASGAPQHAPEERSGRAPDFQQIVSRLPSIALSDLQKGDAVILVATPGSNGAGVTAITLISGVEAILTAAPSGSGAASLLSNWNISSGGEGGGPQ